MMSSTPKKPLTTEAQNALITQINRMLVTGDAPVKLLIEVTMTGYVHVSRVVSTQYQIPIGG
jgi:hypothetical protein